MVSMTLLHLSVVKVASFNQGQNKEVLEMGLLLHQPDKYQIALSNNLAFCLPTFFT